MYLNLGWIGVCLIALILISGYRRASEAFQLYPELGSLILAYIATGLIYNVTEAGFRKLNPCWIFLLLAMFSASGVAGGFVGGKKPRMPASAVAQREEWTPLTNSSRAERSCTAPAAK
jgi:hypothetical protein